MSAAQEVRVGQVWADNDPRSAGRTLRVFFVTSTHAGCQVLSVARNVSERQVGKTTTISLSRFKPNSTGYRLITDAEVTP
jgi:hypothetical protein